MRDHVRTAAFLTLGCKVNQYETDAMKEILMNNGWRIVDFSGPADAYIINTCSVTNMADRKSRQMIHRARKKNPEGVIVACGCYVQNEKDHDSDHDKVLSGADLLVGNNRKKEIASILENYFLEREEASLSSKSSESTGIEDKIDGFFVEDIMKEKTYESMSLSKVEGHTRAFLKIQDGCDQFCSYCIIPYVRGRIRSRDPEEVVAEVSKLARAGFREIVLTGIHMSSYGKDRGDTSLADIIGRIQEVPDIARIRLSSLEPGIITEEFVSRISKYDKLCPHFHLSLQSGCDATLKRMNRHYTTGDYEEALRILRTYYDHPACTTDVIAGFVGETEEEFAQTETFLKKIRLYEMHIFKYSVRKGTRAQKMDGHIPETVKSARSARLIELAGQLKKDYEAFWIGKAEEILLEEKVIIDGRPYMQGYTSRYVKVAIAIEDGREPLRQNTLVSVIISGYVSENLLEGKVIID